MFLKSLEIRGFKSFLDKTEIVFKKGITAIVGPNGSGKSNILDAVKWVLGEQSIKNLRGGKMQDVIFSGTEFRRPVGLGQVVLVLDNSDGKLPIEYTEVTIMRRLFRSGESEYYINNTKCRLKDIQELFMDTGIGKEGYSIIGQGKIEAVLSGKPEERRSLLEEAAGIVKFKTRKEQAEKKLENTEQNIQRIEDIFTTYEERLQPLEKESQKAKTFLDISKELRAKEVTLILNNIDSIQNKIDSLKKQLCSNEDKLQKLFIEREKYKRNLELFNSELENFEVENNEERKRYYKNKDEVQNLSSENNLLNEKIKNLNNIIKKAEKNLNQFKDKVKVLNVEKTNKESIFQKSLNTQDELKRNIFEYEKIINNKVENIEKNDNSLKEIKDSQVELLSQISQNKNEINILKNDINNVQNKLKELKCSTDTYKNSIKININTKELLENEIEKVDSKTKHYEEQIKEYKKQIIFKNKELIIAENKLKEFSSKYNKIEANRNALINLEKQHEGYNRAVKVLMQHIDLGKIPNAKNDSCILGEILEVDKKFEIAIEIALGAGISNIITSNEDIAKELIKYLKHNKLGRATFLPLTIVKRKKINIISKIKNIDGYIGIASEIVNFDKTYINAIEYVLGKTIIAKDMDSALTIAKESRYSFKIVTLSGEVINPGGALTGGSLYHKNSNIISRKREIEELKISMKTYSEKIKEFTENIYEIKTNIKNMDDICLNLRDEIHNQNVEETKIIGKIIAVDNETEKLKRDLNVANNEIILIKESLNNNFKDLKLKDDKVKEIIRLEKEHSLHVYELENNSKNYQEELNAKNNEIVSLRIKKAKIDENIINMDKESRRLSSEVEQINKEVDVLEKEISDSNTEINLVINKIDKNKNKIQIINNILCTLEEKFKDIEIKRLRIKEKIKKDMDDLEKINILYEKYEKNKSNIKVALARGETERDSMYVKLNEEMELTYAEALEIKLDDININNFKEDIEKYKKQISELGTVNLGAVEEYKQLLEKYNFMKDQKEDLIKGKEDLLNVVKEMTDTMKKVFHENFVKLKKSFNETFKELFKGGNADLILEDGDELTSNIEINVQPPGKKLQNINLMSGGEKGLSAIALLFAILKIKPTPFCILDEIEAALDDSNVNRYSEFLKKFSDNTQFVIITHRKGSMEASDVLYGVTMEEKGVSKIVSVDFKK